MGHKHIVYVTLSPCCRERRQKLSLQRCGHLIRQIWIRWTTASGVCFNRGSTASGYMMWVEKTLKVKRTTAEGVEAAGPCIGLPSSRRIAQWHSHLNACVRVNGGHFEHKFWASDFLLCFVCFVDTDCPKCDQYKHVPSVRPSVRHTTVLSRDKWTEGRSCGFTCGSPGSLIFLDRI